MLFHVSETEMGAADDNYNIFFLNGIKSEFWENISWVLGLQS